MAPAWTMAPALNGFTPDSINELAKVFEAMVDPAVVDAVAAAIRIPENGARIKAGRLRLSISPNISVCRLEFWMIPDRVPVPISRAHTPITLLKPKAEYSVKLVILPVANKHTTPPRGRAISGSIVISNSGLRARRTITVIGPKIDAKKDGSSLFSDFSISESTIWSLNFFVIAILINIVAIRAKIAGIILAAIREFKLTPNASLVAIVLGLGLIIFPALPPPIIASNIDDLERLARLPRAREIGATVITAISINTPTEHIIIDAIATAIRAFFSPSLTMMLSAIFSAAPVFTRHPARIPLVMILKTELIIPADPDIMVETVPCKDPLPIIPPIKAPIMSE